MRKLFLTLLLVLAGIPATACTMEPSVWKQIETIDAQDGPGTYALVDALLQIKTKFDREMLACRLATGPLTFTGIWQGEKAQSADSGLYENFATAVNVVWNNALLLPAKNLVAAADDLSAQNAAAGKIAAGYAATVHVTNARSTTINLIDANFKLFHLFRLVLREELRMFVRITDREGTAVFLDEIAVSPTFIVDPLISPVGGFFIRLEKNTAQPLVVDYGPLSEGGEHVLRFNDAFHQPSPTPPAAEFTRPASETFCPTCQEPAP